jgi:hypothetical protein
MTIKHAYINGFQLAVRSPRMIFTLYFTNFILVAIFALSFYSTISSAIGNSMLFDSFMKEENSLFLQDLLHNNGQGILAIVGQLKWALIAYWLLNVFLMGGIIRTFNKQKYGLTVFFGGAGYNFPRFLGLSVLIMLSHFVVFALAALFGFLGYTIFEESFQTERIYAFLIAASIVFYFILAIILFLASDFGKIYLLLNDSQNFFKAYFKAIAFVFKRFFKVYVLYLLLLVVPLVFFYLFTKINGDIGMKTIVGLTMMFFIQQIFIYIRFGFRVWTLGSLFEYYADELLLMNKIALEKERLTELAERKSELSTMINVKKDIKPEEKHENTGNSENINQKSVDLTVDDVEDDEIKVVPDDYDFDAIKPDPDITPTHLNEFDKDDIDAKG